MGACVRVQVLGGCLSCSLFEQCGVFVLFRLLRFSVGFPWCGVGLKRSRAVRRRECVLVSLMSSCNHGACVCVVEVHENLSLLSVRSG